MVSTLTISQKTGPTIPEKTMFKYLPWFADIHGEVGHWDPYIPTGWWSLNSMQVSRDPPPINSHFSGLKIKLDDGWPESVEEQSLLLLVWRHYITR